MYTIVGGGLVGALFVGSIVWTVRALGVTGLSAATLAGQFAAALVIDHFGWLGVDRHRSRSRSSPESPCWPPGPI